MALVAAARAGDRGTAALIAVLALFFALGVAPYWWPGIGLGGFFLFYGLAVMLVLALLLIAGLVGAWYWYRGAASGRRTVLVAVAGFLMFGVAIVSADLLHRDLPFGSFVRDFDRAAWSEPGSASYVKGDITPRQKMLGDIVYDILPTRTRAEVEQILGGSNDPGAEAGTLVYILGPDRSGFTIDFEYLVVRFDERGRFAGYDLTNRD